MAMADVPEDLRTALSGRYDLQRELGRGGMANVYLARDLQSDDLVAIKVLNEDLAAAVGRARFLREIQFAAQLHHPHILPLLDSGEAGNFFYYVMPCVDGESLKERIAREKQLPISDAIVIASEVAAGLDHAHAQGIVHRDVKPGNILLSSAPAVIADFGIARAVRRSATDATLTDVNLAIGTPPYMSPEQWSGTRELDARSDVYSLGCVVYEMLAGHPPFMGPTAEAIAARVAVDPVPPLRTVRPKVSPALEAAILTALGRVPADRFATAGEFARALEAAPVLTVERPALQPWWRRPAMVAGAGLASVATVVGAGALAWRLLVAADHALDTNRVMVYPLVVPADFQGHATIGEDAATMIGSALDGAGPLRWIDAWPLLDPEHRENIRAVTLDMARSLARSRRCGFFVTGRLVARGDSNDVYLELQDVRGDSIVARGSATGAATETWRLALRAVNQVLPTLIPTGAPDAVADWQDRNPTAVASFLLGESAFRRMQLSEALEHYRDAVGADSTFGLAAIRAARAATWNHRPGEAASLIQIAIEHEMSPRYGHFARGYQAYLMGRADSATAELRRALAIDPEMTVAWMQLGEVYTHLLPEEGNPDSLAQAAFEEALRLDPQATNVLLHLIEIRLRRGEVAEAQPMLRRFLATDPDTVLAAQLRIMDACVRSPPAADVWRRLARTQPLALLIAGNTLKGAGSQLPCALSAFTSVWESDTATDAAGEARRWNALVGLTAILLAQGRVADARQRLDSAIAHGLGGSTIYLLAATTVPGLGDRATEIAGRDALAFGANYRDCPYNTRLWILGLWEAHAGRADVVAAIGHDFEERARKSGSAVDRLSASALLAHAAEARGDTSAALRRFTAVLSEGIPGELLAWDQLGPRGSERLALARLLMSRGEFQRAIDVASVFDSPWPLIYTLYLPASLKLRAEAAAALGDARLEERFRGRLAALSADRVVAAS